MTGCVAVLRETLVQESVLHQPRTSLHVTDQTLLTQLIVGLDLSIMTACCIRQGPRHHAELFPVSVSH